MRRRNQPFFVQMNLKKGIFLNALQQPGGRSPYAVKQVRVEVFICLRTYPRIRTKERMNGNK
jgi:hypothetical protein